MLHDLEKSNRLLIYKCIINILKCHEFTFKFKNLMIIYDLFKVFLINLQYIKCKSSL